MNLKFKRIHNNNREYNLYINNLNGILQALSINLVIPFASLYAKRLNATDGDIALLNSYPAIFSILAVFLGTFLFRKYKNKKRVTALSFAFSRSFFILFLFVPFLPLWIQPGIFVLMYGAMSFPNSIANMGWQSYLGDLFSEEWRGRALSVRNSLSTIFALVVTLITGVILYYIPKTDGDRIKLYQLFFFLAFCLSIFEILSLLKYKLDRSSKQIETITEFKSESPIVKLKNIFKIVVSNRKFLDYCICVILFHFAWQMGWPVFFTYEVDVLHSNELWTSISATVSCIVQAISYPLWQKYSEKKGNEFAIFIAIILMALCPFFYMISTKIYHVTIFTIVTGTAVAGTTLLLMNNLYETAPNENRTIYIAVFTVVTNITLIFAPILGMYIKNITNIYVSLFIVGVLRLLSSFSFYFKYIKYKNAKKLES